MASSVDLLTPFNLHSWKGDMEIQIHARGLYRVTMDTKEEPASMTDKARFRFLCLFVSRDLLFHLLGLKTLKEIWDNFETLYNRVI